jgi:hypothetical protein
MVNNYVKVSFVSICHMLESCHGAMDREEGAQIGIFLLASSSKFIKGAYA